MDMKQLLILLIASLSFPTTAIAENTFLILAKEGTTQERIEMASLDECKALGEKWGAISGSHAYQCLVSN